MFLIFFSKFIRTHCIQTVFNRLIADASKANEKEQNEEETQEKEESEDGEEDYELDDKDSSILKVCTKARSRENILLYPICSLYLL